jgi:Fur family ferric uptake transcriptional regulator
VEAIHQSEKKQFARLFEKEGIDRVEERMKILEVFLGLEGHNSFNDILDALVRQGYDFEPDFAKKTINLLCRFGFAFKKEFKGRPTLYEHRHLGYHHDHLICTKCNRIIEFENKQMERIQAEIAAAHGFHMLQHRVEIYGLCSQCLRGRVPLMPLTLAHEGERGIIEEFIGGSGAQLRLATLGLRMGDELEVITNNGQGQVIVAVNDTRLALGRGVATKIMVKPNGSRKDMQ